MDKYATLAVCFLLVLSGVTELVSVSYATTFNLGFSGVGGSSATEGTVITLYNNVSLSVPEGYYANLEQFYFYGNNVSAEQNIHGAVYNEYGSFIGETANIDINGLAWYNSTITGALLTGTYYIGVGLELNVTRYYTTPLGEYGTFYTDGYGFGGSVSPVYNAMSGLSMYVTYSLQPLDATDVTTEQDVNWMAFIVLLAFAFLNVVLILIPRVYILNFVVAALTLAFSVATVNDSTLPIQPYFSLIVALLSVLGILRAANLLRNQ